MILRINGVAAPDIMSGTIENFVDAGAAATGNALSNFAHGVIAVLNANSAEIITLGIIACAVGVMVGPIVGSTKWLGRLFVTFWGGVLWQILT